MINLKEIPKKPGIYKLTNLINGKIYVGKSSNLLDRLKRHRISKNSQLISRAIRKHEWDNFQVEIMQDYDLVNNIELLALETAFIDSEKSLVEFGGYNVCLISNDATGCNHSKEVRNKMSKTRIKLGLAKGKNNSMFGKRHSPETKEKIRQKAIGRIHSEQSRLSMSLSQINRTPPSKETRKKLSINATGGRNPMARKVMQKNGDTNQIVKIWDTVKSASSAMGFSNSYKIMLSCSNKGKLVAGYIWEYA